MVSYEHNLKTGSKATDTNLSRNPHLERDTPLRGKEASLDGHGHVQQCLEWAQVTSEAERREARGVAGAGAPTGLEGWGSSPF